MTRYRLITPHGMYAPGVILDTELPPHRPFSIEQPTAKRLCELGVMEPLDQEDDESVIAQGDALDEPGWSQGASASASGAGAPAQRLDAAPRAATLPAGPARSSSAGSRRKE